jgi:hypothetical protein
MDVHFSFCRTKTHNTENYRALQALAERMEKTSFRVEEKRTPNHKVGEVEVKEEDVKEEDLVEELGQFGSTIAMKWVVSPMIGHSLRGHGVAIPKLQDMLFRTSLI